MHILIACIIFIMKSLVKNLNPFFCDSDSQLFLSDAFIALEHINSECIDMIFADPPYFLSSGGKRVSVNIITAERQKRYINRRLKQSFIAYTITAACLHYKTGMHTNNLFNC